MLAGLEHLDQKFCFYRGTHIWADGKLIEYISLASPDC